MCTDRGTAKIARQLGFDFAEAVTGFEFRKGHANPIISGIVVAAENEAAILEAYWESEQAAAEKEAEKRRAAVIKRWTRLVQGLRMRERLLAQYGTKPNDAEESGSGVVAKPADVDEHVPTTGGGFLTQPDDIVTAYKLPKNYYDVPEEGPPDTPLSVVSRLRASAGPSTPIDDSGTRSTTLFMEEVEDGVREPGDFLPSAPVTEGPILSLAELAVANASRQASAPGSVDEAQDHDRDEPKPGVDTKAGRPRARPVRSIRVAAVQPKPNSRSKRGTASKKRVRGDDSASEVSDREERASKARARAPKRVRTQAAPPPRSDRVLRARSGKSAAQLEQEQEEALRDALKDSE